MLFKGRVAWLAKRTSAQDIKASTAKITIKLINKMAMLLPDQIVIKTQLNLPTINWKLALTGLKGFKKFLAEQLYHPESLDSAWNVHSLP